MKLVQSIDTTGARAVQTYVHGGTRYLVIPQLAADIPGQPAQMTLGNSDIDTLVLRWEAGQFVPHASLPVAGGEDAEHFSVDGREMLAVASLRSGAGPYDLNTLSPIHELRDGTFTAVQQVQGYGAKQWKHWAIGSRHFLGLALGVGPGPGRGVAPRHRHLSTIFEWNGQTFEPAQQIASAWGYNWAHAQVRGQHLVAHADHLAPSLILRWNGASHEPWQELPGAAGRAVCFFHARGEDWLAFARLQGNTDLFRLDGAGAAARYVAHQTLSGPGGRELHWDESTQRLLLVNFIQGSREAPQPQQRSVFFHWAGDRLVPGESFETCGGTDAALFSQDGARYMVVSESLSPQIRFRTPSRLYRLDA